MERFFGNRRITLYASGTAALAQAMVNCAARSSTSAPEVIIPAYGCPDLVAACLHAKVYPRLVDVAPAHWAYDLESLESSLSPNTVAVVAVNLLGVGDSADELIRICKDRRIPLIQDSAQYLPRECIKWPGDYVVLSFGRGKPLNLLHGGALIEPPGSHDTRTVHPTHYSPKDRLLSSRATAIAFNVLTHPYVYGIASALPATRLGEVIYKPLDIAQPLPERAWERVGIAFERYRQKPSYRRDLWASAIKEWRELGIVELRSPDTPVAVEPLRLTLLAPDRVDRELLVGRLTRKRLGASRLYASDLTGVTGIPENVRRQGPFPHAKTLADRLFTLPTYDLLRSDTIRMVRDAVLAWHRSSTGPRPP